LGNSGGSLAGKDRESSARSLFPKSVIAGTLSALLTLNPGMQRASCITTPASLEISSCLVKVYNICPAISPSSSSPPKFSSKVRDGFGNPVIVKDFVSVEVPANEFYTSS
jgi:hypothetical protein